MESKSEVIKCLVEYTDKNYIYEDFTIEDGELTVTKKKRWLKVNRKLRMEYD